MQAKTALKLGMDSEAFPSDAQAEIYSFPQHVAAHVDSSSDENADHFISRDGKCFAGTHLIVDVFGGSRLDDIEHIRQMMRDAVAAAGATLLHIHLHHFTPNGGVSGVAVLAESHISIHTWPERDYAALDVFMCGDSVPHQAIEVIRQAFEPRDLAVGEYLRGEMAPSPETA